MTKDKTNIEEIKESVLQKFYKEMAYQDGSDPTGSTWCMYYESADRVWDWFEKEAFEQLKDQVQAEKEFFLHYTELTESEFNTRFEQFKKEQREHE